MPSGEAGVMIFNADYHVLQYCDGTNWMRVGESSEDARIGTLTAGKWCAANGGGTGLDCTQDAPVSAVTLTGDVTGTGSGSVATTIANGVVTYAKIQNTTADSVLLGRGAGAGAGTVQELMLGAGLALTGTVLSATATPSPASPSSIRTIRDQCASRGPNQRRRPVNRRIARLVHMARWFERYLRGG